MGEQGRVVAGPGSDLEDTLARCHVEQLEHDRHEGRGTRRGHRDTTLVKMRRNGSISSVGLTDRSAGNERMPRHGKKGPLDRLGTQGAPGNQLLDQLREVTLRRTLVHGAAPPRPTLMSSPTDVCPTAR